MNITHEWLAEFVPNLPGVDETADVLASLGLPVETVTHLPGAPAGVLVADVTSVTPVEGSDRLTWLTLNAAGREASVVCGAPNVHAGMRTAWAPPGTELPALGVTVETKTVHSHVSEGMVCSPKELGIFDDASGLLALGPDVEPGTELAGVWPGATVMDVELTPNRADAFSVRGIARDLCAKLGVQLTDPTQGLQAAEAGGDAGVQIAVDDPAGCPHLVVQRIDGVTVRPSPVWLQARLAALGLRPRNGIVDVTNYVTYELGQPSHAYDLGGLHEDGIKVRAAKPDESLELLDGREITLHADDLVIATGGGAGHAVGLAGVMGGAGESVTPATTHVALEVAHFNPVRIRKAAKRHALHTDAHLRFERGVDPDLPPLAAARAAQLIATVSGGEVRNHAALHGGTQAPGVIDFRPSRVGFLMGFDVTEADQRTYLERLGCTVQAGESGALRVTPPSWRFDLAIEEDLIEEVARLHGYEHIAATKPELDFTPPERDATHRSLRSELVSGGHQETIAYVFTGDSEAAAAHAPAPQVHLSNPQGVERSALRTALYPGLLRAAAQNQAAPGLKLFEIGRVFLEEEQERLAVLHAGRIDGASWQTGEKASFHRLKGTLETLAERSRARVSVTPAGPDAFPMLHPGVAGRVHWNDREIGMIGRLHPAIERHYELPETFVLEVNLPLDAVRLSIHELPRQPYAERDVAVVVPTQVPYSTLEAAVNEAAGAHVLAVFPFDVYQGKPLAHDQKSVAIRVRWRHPDRALTDAEVDERLQQIVTRLQANGYELRG